MANSIYMNINNKLESITKHTVLVYKSYKSECTVSQLIEHAADIYDKTCI